MKMFKPPWIAPNGTYYSFEQLLVIFGSVWTQDVLFISLIPIGFIGFLLNILTLIILNDKSIFELKVFDYLRLFTVNSGTICLLIMTRFVDKSQNIIEFSNSYVAVFYFTKIYYPLINILFFNGTCLDILLSFDRVVSFSNRFQWFKRMNTKIVSLIIVIVSPIAMVDFWLYSEPKTVSVFLNATQTQTFYLDGPMKTSNKISPVVTLVISDLIPICIELSLSITTIFLLKRYINNKKNITQVKLRCQQEKHHNLQIKVQ
jgi:hypothetical protein